MARNPQANDLIPPTIPAAESTSAAAGSASALVAKAGTYYRFTHLLMGVLLIGWGVWSIYDGFVGWPQENQTIAHLKIRVESARKANDDETYAKLQEQLKLLKEHDDLSIRINCILGVLLPLAGLAMIFWTLHNSRGTYRLEGKSLSIPGHPTISLDDIRKVDQTRWDRKGVAYLTYQVSGSPPGKIRLDDFVYERTGTDAIYDRIKAHMASRTLSA